MDTLVTDRIEGIVLSWLRGQSGEAPGERVLIFTYGDNAYLGAYEGDYICKYHVEGGRLRESSMGDAPLNERHFSTLCGALVKRLRDSGTIKQVPCPRQYDGAAVLYVLAA